MKLTISDANKIQQFSTILVNLKQFLENITCQVKEDGMYFQGLDQTHSCMIECSLKKDWFSLFENDANLIISFNTSMIQKVLNARHESQEIEIECDPDDDVLTVGFTKGNNFNKTFQIPLMHIENNNFEMQDIETDVDLTIDTKKMHDLIANLANFNDDLKMNFTEDKIMFTSNGLEGMMNVEIDFNDLTEYAVGENVELTQSFNLKILNQMCNYCKLTNEMNIGFTNGRPMNLKYLVEDDSYVQFYLAPKVDD